MIDIYSYYARCNTAITNNMLDIIKKHPESYSFETNGYYKSISSILDHIYTSNLNWIKAFCSVMKSAVGDKIQTMTIPEYGDKVFYSIEEALNGLQETLEMTEIICNEFNENDYNKILIRKRRNGEVMEKIAWKAMIHYFNHQTHHRGQISEILDELKIDNDYSNMIFLE